MNAYADNVVELPELRFRTGVYPARAAAVQQIQELVAASGSEPDLLVYANPEARWLATALSACLDLPCLRLGPGIRDLVRANQVLLVDIALADLQSLLTAIDWLLVFKPAGVSVAAVTGHRHAIDPLAEVARLVLCPNIRCSWEFTAADAFASAESTPLPAGAEATRNDRELVID